MQKEPTFTNMTPHWSGAIDFIYYTPAAVEPFRWLLADARARRVPLILETPQQNYEIADDDLTPDPYDVRMMDLRRGML